MNRPDPFRVTPAQIARATRWPIGTPVTVTKDDGSLFATVTRSNPWRLNLTWVILVEGISEGVALARVQERPDDQARGAGTGKSDLFQSSAKIAPKGDA